MTAPPETNNNPPPHHREVGRRPLRTQQCAKTSPEGPDVRCFHIFSSNPYSHHTRPSIPAGTIAGQVIFRGPPPPDGCCVNIRHEQHTERGVR